MLKSYTKRTKKEALKFARKIIPTNWNIFLDSKELKKEKNILNIALHLFDDAEMFSDYSVRDGVEIAGFIKDMRFFMGCYFTELIIFEPTDWEDTLIHELAHIAVHRWIFFKAKGYRKESINIRGKYYELGVESKKVLALENVHGVTFEKALDNLTLRAVNKEAFRYPRLIYERDKLIKKGLYNEIS